MQEASQGTGAFRQGDVESWPEQSWVEGDWDRGVEWVQEEGLDTRRLETSGHTRVQGERTVPPQANQDPPPCWMWSRGMAVLMCRYGGVCGVNGSTSPSLLVARRPHPSHDSPPALQHNTQGSAWPSPTFPSGFTTQYFASCSVSGRLVTDHTLDVPTSGSLLQLLLLPQVLFLPVPVRLRPPGQLQHPSSRKPFLT